MLPQLETPTNNLYECIVTGATGIYTLTWPQLHIEAKVSRISESRTYEITAGVIFTSKRILSESLSQSGHLLESRVKLTSTSGNKALSKSLSDLDGTVTWEIVIEQLSVAVLAEFRKGNPLVELDGDMDLMAEDKWMIRPILQLYNPTLIYGPGSTGKSFFAQWLACLVDSGLPSAGLQVDQGRVLYLDYETSEKEVNYRFTMIRRRLGLEGKSHIFYRSMTRGLYDDIERIREICIEKQITFVVIDSMNSACGEPEAADAVLRAFNALRSIKMPHDSTASVTSLIVDHTNKEDKLFGSQAKFTQARLVFRAKKSQEESSDTIVLGIFHEKSNNSKLIKPIGFELVFHPEDRTMSVIRKDVKDTALEEHMKVADRIANALSRSGKLTVSEIAEEIDKEESHVRKELSYGKKSGRFILLTDGKWALPARRDEIVRETFQRELEGEI